MSGRRKTEMAAVKPEVLISQLLGKIAAPFQATNLHFQVQEFNDATPNTAGADVTGVAILPRS